MATIDDFKKLELKIGTILSAERVEGSDKLIKLMVNTRETDLPAGRQILAGIGRAYEPEALITKQIVVITNLEPRMMMGLESQGMLLAADGESGPVFLTPEKPTLPGSAIH